MCSEYDFFDVSLKVIRATRRWLESRHFTLVAHAPRVAQKQPLQSAHDAFGGRIAVQEFQQVRFQRMKGVGPIDLLGILALRAMVREDLAGQAGQHALDRKSTRL